MSLTLRRLRPGELIAGLGAVLLLLSLFVLSWYTHAALCRDGWDAFTALRWVLLLDGALGLALPLAQARMRAPALPVSLATATAGLSAIALVWLALDLLTGAPDGFQARAGGPLGLLAVALLFAGAVASLRQEGQRPEDGPGEIPVVVPWGEQAG